MDEDFFRKRDDMIPEPGKWYNISYGKKGSRKAYHGPAVCLRKGNDFEGAGTWIFRAPNQPDGQCVFAYMIFLPRDIKSETESEPTYEELKQLVSDLQAEVERRQEELVGWRNIYDG